MRACWEMDDVARPSFAELQVQLGALQSALPSEGCDARLPAQQSVTEHELVVFGGDASETTLPPSMWAPSALIDDSAV